MLGKAVKDELEKRKRRNADHAARGNVGNAYPVTGTYSNSHDGTNAVSKSQQNSGPNRGSQSALNRQALLKQQREEKEREM